jgi:hypothetical protein
MSVAPLPADGPFGTASATRPDPDEAAEHHGVSARSFAAEGQTSCMP